MLDTGGWVHRIVIPLKSKHRSMLFFVIVCHKGKDKNPGRKESPLGPVKKSRYPIEGKEVDMGG